MTKAVKITTHVTDAQKRLVHQFKDKPKIDGKIKSYVDQIQDLEEVFYDMLTLRNIDTAQGAQLDGMGSIVGEPRAGRGDFDYRIAIKVKIAINTSEGTPEEVIALFTYFVGATKAFYAEYPRGEVEIFANTLFEDFLTGDGEDAFAMDGGIDGLGFGDLFDTGVGGTFAQLNEIDFKYLFYFIDRLLPAGVRLLFIGQYDGDEGFSFEGSSDGLGFGDVNDVTIGGKFAKVLLPVYDFSLRDGSILTKGLGNLNDRFVGGEFTSL